MPAKTGFTWTTSLFATTLAIGLYVWRKKKLSLAGRNLPPGPPQLPLVGNLFDIPPGRSWLTFERWGKEYENAIIYLNVLGTPIVVVNSAEAATELLERKSVIYYDWDRNLLFRAVAFMLYGDRWLGPRQPGVYAIVHSSTVKDFRLLQRKTVRRLLQNLFRDPGEFVAHLRTAAVDATVPAADGVQAKAQRDVHIEEVDAALISSISIFNVLSLRMRILSWFQSVCGPHHAMADALMKCTPALSTALASFLRADSLNRAAEKEFPSGPDTTVCAMEYFFLAMSLYRGAQRRAQAEIDAAIGNHRSPDFTDKDSLPYVNALVIETLRWCSVTPLGPLHRLKADDVYDGYFLPAGSVVIGNNWAIMHDEKVYGSDALKFRPERFLENDLRFSEHIFGYGRRICPARYITRDLIWLAIVSILATFDISKALDENGNEIEPPNDCHPGFMAYPVTFECGIRPRSPATEQLVMLMEVAE